MFGLSIKEKLYKAMLRLCEEKLPEFESDMRKLISRAEGMSEKQTEREYNAIVLRYSSAVTQSLHQSLGSTVGLRVGMAMMNPHITGLPEEYDTDFDASPFVGKFFAIYYYAATGKQISYSDYGKYIRPINQYQTSLINRVFEKLSN